MKKLLTVVLSVILLCGCFAVTAFMADEGGLSFKENTVYFVDNDLEADPVTIEAYIYINKRVISNKSFGSVFGNYRGIPDTGGMALDIAAGGHPKLRIKDERYSDEHRDKGDGTYLATYEFTDVSVCQSRWVHLTIVRDMKNLEIRCYIDGELKGTMPAKDLDVFSRCEYVVGGDMTNLNQNYFRSGKLGSLAVYSDIRTEAEIKKDMEKVGTEDLILHYDFMDNTEETPAVLTDLSKYKNNATFSRIFIDEKEPVTDYAYTFAVLGDTQSVVLNSPLYFNKMYEYIYDNINEKNIEMVLGVGDITDTNNGANTPYEWQVVLEGMKIIDDYVPQIPVRGNHDSVFWYDKTMAEINYADIIDGHMVDGDYKTTYVDMEIGGIPYLFLQLDFFLTNDMVEWAKSVVEKFPNHNVIVSTHAYMNANDEILDKGDWLDPSSYGKDYITAQSLWDNFLSQYENIVLVLCGHVSTGTVSTTQRKGVHGNTVTEMLIDFQGTDDTFRSTGISENSGGFVTLLHFSEDGKKVTVENYSTILEKYFYDYNQFTVELDTVTDKKYVKPVKTPVPPRTAVTATEIKMSIDSLTAFVNGEAKTLDAAPIIRNSRTMLPVRFVAENLGATVGWDDATKTVTIRNDTTTIEIVIGSGLAKVNNKNVPLDSPAFIENSRTYLPVRVVAENLGATVLWDDATKTATLSK